MATFCLVENGKIIEGPRTLPRKWRNTSQLDLSSIESLEAKGWLMYIDEPPEYDEDIQYLTHVKVISKSNVTANYTINDYKPDEMVDRIIIAKADRKTAIRNEVQAVIEDKYPIHVQRYAALGIYTERVINEIKEYIQNVLAESNRCEVAVDAAETLAEVRNVQSVWPTTEINP